MIETMVNLPRRDGLSLQSARNREIVSCRSNLNDFKDELNRILAGTVRNANGGA